MRKTIIAGNWKMYKNITQAIELSSGLKREFFDDQDIDIVICPPFTALASVHEVTDDSPVQLGAQDTYWQEEGAFTGEVSPSMLKDAGCKFVIIGHSERRQFFGETNESVNKKIKAVLKVGLNPIACVGETLGEREAGRTFEILDSHIKNGLKDISEKELLKIVVAYEPVWAIGTGKTATVAQAQEAHKYIRSLLTGIYDKDTAELVRIQYGGSVNPENISELLHQPDVDGALVGGGSLLLDSFAGIIRKAKEVKK